MIEHPELFIGLGVFGVVFGAGLLVLVARRARRAKRSRVAVRRAAYRQGSAPLPHQAGWQRLDPAGAATIPPPATSVPPPPLPSGVRTSDRGGRVYGTPTRDRDETSVMPRHPWGGNGRG